MSKETMPMKTVRGPLTPDELMRLECLVPREGYAGVSCHEKTFCDCEVLALNDALVAARSGNAIFLETLEDTIGERDAALAKLKTLEKKARVVITACDESAEYGFDMAVEDLRELLRETTPLRKETGACAMCGALAEEQVVPPKTDPGQYLDRSMVSIHGSDGCSNCETGRITIYAASRWCLECQAKSPTRSGA